MSECNRHGCLIQIYIQGFFALEHALPLEMLRPLPTDASLQCSHSYTDYMKSQSTKAHYTLKTKPKIHSDHLHRPVPESPRNQFQGPKGTRFSEKNEYRKSGSKTVPPLYFFNKNGPKNDHFCSLSGHIRTEIQVSKNGTPWATKTGLGHQKRTDFTYQTPIQPRLRRCGDETKGFGMHLKRNTDMTCFIHIQK